MDHQPRPGVPAKKRQRDRLIHLATTHPQWALGFADEVWWSRISPPALHAWTAPGPPLRLVEQPVAPDEAKALACYGLLVRWWPGGTTAAQEAAWLRFVDGRPVSGATTQCLAWCCAKLAAAGKTALLLVWDNAGWHLSRQVQTWIAAHNRQVQADGQGVRSVECRLPTKSPWLNPIEPKWTHGKRRVVEPARLLPAAELEDRVYAALDADHADPLTIPEQVA